jgi:thiol:disulfide interchange protein DsbC
VRLSAATAGLRGLILLGLVPATMSAAWAADTTTDATSDTVSLETLRQNLQKAIPELTSEDVRPAGVAGLFEVQLGSQFAYVTPDGGYLLSGDLVDLNSGARLTEQRRRQWRLQEVAPLEADAIVFPAKGARRASVTVFTDIDCRYCRQWHRQVPDLNDQGVEVRYLFFPRSGPGSASYRKAGQVWCAADPQAALTRAKQDRKVKDERDDCAPPIDAQWSLAQALELRATPALLMPDGQLKYGFRSVEDVLRELGASAQPPP